MKDQHVANQDHHDRAPEAAAAAGIGAKGAARRRFAKAGLGATGVILTLASKPGMASVSCTSASGFASGPASSNSPSSLCEGRSPGYWKNWPEEWASANINSAAKFSDVFGASTSPALAGMTLMEVLDPNGNNGKDKDDKGSKGGKGGSEAPSTIEVKDVDPDNVARHIIAALLNARSRRVPQLPESEVLEIWRQYVATRSYAPRPGVIWNGPDIVFYLKSTMI